jgi:hypothetical protein
MNSFVTGRFKAVGPNGAPKPKALAVKECQTGVCDTSVAVYKTVEVLPVMAPPTPLPQTGTVTPASGVQVERCEPWVTLPIVDGVRFGMMREWNR